MNNPQPWSDRLKKIEKFFDRLWTPINEEELGVWEGVKNKLLPYIETQLKQAIKEAEERGYARKRLNTEADAWLQDKIKQAEKAAVKAIPNWCICTDFLGKGGQAVMSGFRTKELALKVRQLLEDKHRGKTYAIDTLFAQEGKDG